MFRDETFRVPTQIPYMREFRQADFDMMRELVYTPLDRKYTQEFLHGNRVSRYMITPPVQVGINHFEQSLVITDVDYDLDEETSFGTVYEFITLYSEIGHQTALPMIIERVVGARLAAGGAVYQVDDVSRVTFMHEQETHIYECRWITPSEYRFRIVFQDAKDPRNQTVVSWQEKDGDWRYRAVDFIRGRARKPRKMDDDELDALAWATQQNFLHEINKPKDN